MLDQVHVHDASARRRDPTQTGIIRRKFRAAAKFRLNMLRARMRVAVIDNDILGLTAESGTQHHPPDVRLNAFHSWISYSAGLIFETDWYVHFIESAWRQGVQRAHEELNLLLNDTTDPSHAIRRTRIEIQGIVGAIVQVVGRAAADATGSRGNRRYRVMQKLVFALQKAALPRFVALANTMVVKAFNEAKLEVYRKHGIRKVGVNPEHFRKDAVTHDAAWVGFATAGDDFVCQMCEDYADGSPYGVDEVETSLHVGCRCEVIPWDNEGD